MKIYLVIHEETGAINGAFLSHKKAKVFAGDSGHYYIKVIRVDATNADPE